MKIAMKLKPGESLVEALQKALEGKEPTDDILKQIRRDQYKLAVEGLKADSSDARWKAQSKEPPKIEVNRSDKTVEPLLPMKHAAFAIHLMEDALKTNNQELLRIGALMFNMSAIELNEFFKAAHASDELILDVQPQQDLIEKLFNADDAELLNSLQGGFDYKAWPEELWALLTAKERSIVEVEGFRPDSFPPPDKLPYCPAQPCTGCDLRKKVLAFADKIAAEQRGEGPPGTSVH